MVEHVLFLCMTIKIILCKYQTGRSLTYSVYYLIEINVEIMSIFISKDQQILVYPADVVLFEGILIFYFPAIRDLFHMKLFVDMDSDVRLADRG